MIRLLLTLCLAIGCARGPLATTTPRTAFDELQGSFVAPGDAGAVGALVAVWEPAGGEAVILGAQCTGIRLRGGVILTNAHCAPASPAPDVGLYWSNALRARDASSAQIGVDGSAFVFKGSLAVPLDEVPRTRLVQPALQREEGVLDYQLLELAVADESAPYLELEGEESEGESILLSHPFGMPLFRSDHCSRWRVGDEILHDCDSLKGSSGGALIDPSSGRLVALHKQGFGSNSAAAYAQRGRFESREELVAAAGADELAAAFNKAVSVRDLLADFSPPARLRLSGSHERARR